jgi:gamma-glutamylcyclotransferase (GGCT)/AIG2-like uncharacterized protein YtfP
MPERATDSRMADSTRNRSPVFVYGTLMRGQSAHAYLSDAEYAGEYRLPGYAMYDLGRYPGIVPKPGQTVYGEVYRVSDRMLREMDRYEGEGSLYHRVRVNAENESGTASVYVYVYAKKTGSRLIPDGRWNRR